MIKYCTEYLPKIESQLTPTLEKATVMLVALTLRRCDSAERGIGEKWEQHIKPAVYIGMYDVHMGYVGEEYIVEHGRNNSPRKKEELNGE